LWNIFDVEETGVLGENHSCDASQW